MSEELDNDAAEYVLGTLPADERARFAERLRTDPTLRAEVNRLQARLSPLDDLAAPVPPRPEVWATIERQTLPTAAANVAAESAGSNVFALRRRLNLWRGSTFIAGALAAGLAAIVVLDRTAVAPVVEGGRYVAVVDSDGHEPALIAEVDTVAGIIRVRSLKAETPQGKSLELWHVEEGKQPRSLGILKAGLDAQSIEDTAGAASGLLAVSVEPEGGSPSGAPTGPIVYTGRLIPVE
jgi:anti-sigma-K factor RskA